MPVGLLLRGVSSPFLLAAVVRSATAAYPEPFSARDLVKVCSDYMLNQLAHESLGGVPLAGRKRAMREIARVRAT